MSSEKTIGQVVDDLAYKYFASGMDAYSAGVKACIDVAHTQIELLEKLPILCQQFYDGLVKKKD